MRYAILKTGFGEGCDYTIGCNMSWNISEFEGVFDNLVKKTINECLYYGDEDGNKENYSKITDMDGQVKELVIIGIDNNSFRSIDMVKEIEKHNKWYDDEEVREKERVEKETYEKLKKKFEGQK